jgi:hypothetical protein
MTLDGDPVELTPDLDKGIVSYSTDVGDPKKSVVKPLKDGIHTVVLNVKDYAGNLLTKEWNFTADSSMPPPRRTKAATDVGKKTKDPTVERPHRRNQQDQNTPNTGGYAPPPPAPGGPGDSSPGDYGGRRRGRYRGYDQPQPGQ